MLLLVLRCLFWLHTTGHAQLDHLLAARHRFRTGDDRGQATAEYALVMLGAAVVALLVVTWATAGGGAGKVGRLFDRVLDAVIDRV